MSCVSSEEYEQLEYLPPHSQSLLDNNNQEQRQVSLTTNPPVTMSGLPLHLTGSWPVPQTSTAQLAPFLQDNAHLALAKPVNTTSQDEPGEISVILRGSSH